MLAANLPILPVIVPLLGAPLALLLQRSSLSWLAAMVAALAAFSASVLLLMQVSAEGAQSYALGGWAPPWGIEFRLDTVNSFVLLIVSAMACVVLLFAPQSVAREIPRQSHALFYTAFLLCLAGLLGMAATGDAFNLFVFLEISSLSSYVLIALGRDRRALTASFQYLIMGTIGATLILIGVGLLYVMTGTLNMADLAERLPAVMDKRTVHSAFGFLIVGLSLKLALFPLHLWLPNAYAFAPSAVSAFLAATATKVAIYALLRFAFTVFGVEFAFEEMALQWALLALSIVAILYGSVAAIYQTNIKHLLAYSSIAQVGYIMLGVSLISQTGLTAGIVHLFNHALMKGGLFLALGCIIYRCGGARISDFHGIGKTMPWTMAAIVVGGLGLIGAPPTVGLISKWYLVLAALEQGWWWLAVFVLAASLLAVAYVWKLVDAAYLHDPDPDTKAREAPLTLLLPTWALIGASLYFGVDIDLTIGVASQAAAQLLGGAP